MTESLPLSSLLNDVRAILQEARGKAYAAANTAMVDAYWRIGRRIVEEEQGGAARTEYGSQLIRHLARALGEEFGQGMSVANLRNFRQFYLTFADAGKHYALRSELSWTHWRDGVVNLRQALTGFQKSIHPLVQQRQIWHLS